MFKIFGRVALLFLLLLGSPVLAQSPTPDNAENPATSDYLPNSMQLLFPSLPASFPTDEVQPPTFDGAANGFDMIALGTIPGPEGITSTPLTKTLTLNLTGGVKGRIFSRPAWLSPNPDRFLNIKGAGELKAAISVKRDAGQGAGILPGQTNWGRMRVVLNGAVFDYAVQLVVGTPAAVTKSSGDKVFGLHQQIVTKLDSLGDLATSITTPLYPNASQFALGLVVDYLGEKGYNGKMSEEDFVGRVAETLAEKDYNNDGWIGFKPEDIVIGAPGWVLGHKTK